jgi:hypothetical protein
MAMKLIDPDRMNNLYKVHLPTATFYFKVIGEEEGDGIWPCRFLVISGTYRPYDMHVPWYSLEEYERIGKVEIIKDPSEYAKFLLSEPTPYAHL